MYPICYLDFQILDAHTDVVESKLFDIGSKHLAEYLSTSFSRLREGLQKAKSAKNAEQHFALEKLKVEMNTLLAVQSMKQESYSKFDRFLSCQTLTFDQKGIQYIYMRWICLDLLIYAKDLNAFCLSIG